MKKKHLFKKDYLIILIVTLLVGHPLLFFDTTNGHDLAFHIFRVRSTTMAFLDGQIIPMIDTTVARGFGYAYNMFYGVLPTYLVGFLNILFNNWTFSYNIFLFICIYLCGIFMYQFVKDVFKNNKIGLISAIVYISFPYFLTDIYIRQALGEFLAFIFIPLLFHGIYNLINDDGKKFYYITIGTAGLLLSHNLSTLMTAIFATIYLCLNVKKIFKKEILKKLFISLGFAVLISLITLGPLLEAKFSTRYEVFYNAWMQGSAQNMNGERLGINRLISSNLFIQYDQSSSLLSGSMPFDLGFACIISLIALLFTYNKFKGNDKKNLKQFLIMSGIALLMTSFIIDWWFLPSFLYMFQFPWRFLLMATFFLSIVSGCSIYKIFENFKDEHILLVILVCFVAIYPLTGYTNYSEKISNSIFEDDNLINSHDIGSAATGSNEYFTKNMIENMPYLKYRDDGALILKGSAIISDYTKNGTNVSFNINADEDSLIEVPLTYYKGYTANNKFNIVETENGLVGVEIKSGSYNITIKYSNTIIQFLSYVISIISIIVFTIYVKKFKNKTKKA